MSFILARLNQRSVPRVRVLPVQSGSAWSKGALLVRNANAEWAECGADPAAIAAVAEHGVGADVSGYAPLNVKEFPPGQAIGTLIQGETAWRAEYVGTLPAADGGSYGVVRDTDGRWKVDFADTVATRVRLVNRFTRSPENVAQVEVVFLPANVQIQ